MRVVRCSWNDQPPDEHDEIRSLDIPHHVTTHEAAVTFRAPHLGCSLPARAGAGHGWRFYDEVMDYPRRALTPLRGDGSVRSGTTVMPVDHCPKAEARNCSPDSDAEAAERELTLVVSLHPLPLAVPRTSAIAPG